MPGVIPALITGDDVGLLGQIVGNLAFTLVSPLRTNDNDC
jgi:hypothetical protein